MKSRSSLLLRNPNYDSLVNQQPALTASHKQLCPFKDCPVLKEAAEFLMLHSIVDREPTGGCILLFDVNERGAGAIGAAHPVASKQHLKVQFWQHCPLLCCNSVF